MEAPNRKDEVEELFHENKGLLDGTEEGRLNLLRVICDGLNVYDDDKWGLLYKPEQNKIPADILVWKDTLEHFDVLTDSGPVWIPRGIIQDGWEWVESDFEVPETPEIPGDTVPYDESLSVDFGNGINVANNEYFNIHGVRINDGGMTSVMSQRACYSYYVNRLPWEESKRKHLNEYRAEYGLSQI